MDFNRLDLNLLVVFNAIFHVESVSVAARQLNISQPSVSAALSRLRQVLKDPLFVRTRGGMIPTKRARDLAQPVQQALGFLRQALIATEGFDPMTSDRTFTLLLSEIGQIVFLPQISEMMRQKAPRARLVIAATKAANHLDEFEKGKIDLGMGVWPHLKSDVVRNDLFSDEWCCIVRKGHPSFSGRLTLKKYLAAKHVAVCSVSGGDEAITRILDRNGLQRRVALEVTDFLAPPMIVARTDLVATVPTSLARFVANFAPLTLLRPPIKLPPIRVCLYGHKEMEYDSGRRWLAQAIGQLFQGKAA